jgi:predicted dehydrogenase
MPQSRRKFLQSVGLGSFILSLPELSQAKDVFPFADKKLRIALVGLGYYAEFKLMPGILESKYCTLGGIVTGTPGKAVKWKAKYNIPDKNIYNYQDFDSIINNPDIDAVYVVLPNSMHHEYVIRGAKAGKHVFCEKPMAVSVTECEEMIDACKKANRKLFIGYRDHFEPHNMEAMRVGQSKEFGKVKVVESSMGFKMGNPNQWRLKKAMAGGGAMYDVGIYAIQGARYAIGSDPIYVTAQEFKTDPVMFKEVDETVLWTMEFPGGEVSTSVTSYSSPSDRLYISAENGWLELEPAFGYGPQAGRTSKGPLSFAQTNHQAVMLDEMAQGVLSNKVLNITGEEGLTDQKIMAAIYRSIQSGKREKI